MQLKDIRDIGRYDHLVTTQGCDVRLGRCAPHTFMCTVQPAQRRAWPWISAALCLYPECSTPGLSEGVEALTAKALLVSRAKGVLAIHQMNVDGEKCNSCHHGTCCSKRVDE